MKCSYGVKCPGCEYQVECEVLEEEIREIEEYVEILRDYNKELKQEIGILKSELNTLYS